MPMHNYEAMEFPELLNRFVSEFRSDGHSEVTAFERSNAQKELRRRGQESLRPILDYLQETGVNTKRLLDRNETDAIWARLFWLIELDIDPQRSGPKDRRNFRGWIEWAEKFT